ncbi:MAG: VWA domain-containing protein, partial [Anaerolineae bacterium]|nr:VWA domain-containing protein [Anaerolineae bacterium]
MSFTTPLILLLLFTIPYFVWLARPRTGGWRRWRWRDWLSVGLRVVILVLLVLSLAGIQIVRSADDLAVVFLVDASDSISQEQAAQAETYVRTAIETMGPNDQTAVILFGANALVDRPMSGLAELAPITTVPQALQTDIAKAVRLGLALFPAGSARRLVVLSDGQPTIGDVAEAANLAAASGVQLDFVDLERPLPATEALLTNVSAPTKISQGETFRIDITAESTADMPAKLRVLAGGSIVHEENV